MRGGTRWLGEVLRQLHFLLFFAALTVGVGLSGVLLHHAAWLLGGFALLVLLVIFFEGAFRAYEQVRPRGAGRDRRPYTMMRAALLEKITEAQPLIARLGELSDPVSDRVLLERVEEIEPWTEAVERLLEGSFRPYFSRYSTQPPPQRIEMMDTESLTVEFVRTWLEGKVQTLERICDE
jgi:membrane protein implicated in regulation of membrane protease activity